MFAQSSDSVNTDDIAEFLDDSIKGKKGILRHLTTVFKTSRYAENTLYNLQGFEEKQEYLKNENGRIAVFA